jgi:2,3-bisphosphoglycerate-independent phosphoglycerate mutase
MADLDLIHGLLTPADTRILLLVLDGLGGLAVEPGGPTELEAADTPNLDRLVAEGIAGLHQPVGPGITPGSGPGHIGLFGYDAVRYQIGRGVLEGLGIGFDLQPDDLAARGNFCTIDGEGNITDRRAGRISTERCRELCAELQKIEVPGVQVFVEPVREHRFLLVLRGAGLVEGVADTDPGHVGVPPLDVVADKPVADGTAAALRSFVTEAKERLAGHEPANMAVLRGFARLPDWPLFPDVFGLRSVAVAQYPMYRGVAKLVGMDSVEVGPSKKDLFSELARVWPDHDFAFVHVKDTDKTGEDGDFDGKVAAIEEIDRHIPQVVDLQPDVVIVTGDHSTPAALRSHSWHPVPFLLRSPTARRDGVDTFGEKWCLGGGGGICRSEDLMPLALAHAGRLAKFGA